MFGEILEAKKTSGSSKHRSQSTRRQYKMENNLAQSQINTSGRSKSKAGGRLLVASVHLYSGTRSRRRSWFALLSTTLLFPDEKIQTNQHKQQHDRERAIKSPFFVLSFSLSPFFSFSQSPSSLSL